MRFKPQDPSAPQPKSYFREIQTSSAGVPALEVNLQSRKNRRFGSVLVRQYRCPQDRILCPVVRDLINTERRSAQGKLFSTNPTTFHRTLHLHLSAIGEDPS